MMQSNPYMKTLLRYAVPVASALLFAVFLMSDSAPLFTVGLFVCAPLFFTSLTVVLLGEVRPLTRERQIVAWALAVVLPLACLLLLPEALVFQAVFLLVLAPCLVPWWSDRDEARFFNFSAYYLGRGFVLLFALFLAFGFYYDTLWSHEMRSILMACTYALIPLLPVAFAVMVALRPQRPGMIDQLLALLAGLAAVAFTVYSLVVVVTLFVEDEASVAPEPFGYYLPMGILLARIMAEPHLDRVPKYVRTVVRFAPLLLLPACICTLVILVTESLSLGLAGNQVDLYLLLLWNFACLFLLVKRSGMLRGLMLSLVVVYLLILSGAGNLLTSNTGHGSRMEFDDTVSEEVVDVSDNMERITNPILADDVEADVAYVDEDYGTPFTANADGEYMVVLKDGVTLDFTAEQAEELKAGMAGDAMPVVCNGRADGFLLTAFECDHDIDNDTYYVRHIAGRMAE